MLTVIQAILYFRWESRGVIRKIAYLAVFVVLLQALLGGLTVLLRLPPQVSIAHACLAQIFFCLTIILTLTTSKAWRQAKAQAGLREGQPASLLPTFSVVVCAAFFLQLLLGATMRHLGAGLAIPDFPSVFGGVIPPSWTPSVAIHYAHRVGAVTVITLSACLVVQIQRKLAEALDVVALAGGVMALLCFQFLLGAMVIWLRKPVPMTMLHLATGALCLGLSVALSLQIFRIRWITQRT